MREFVGLTNSTKQIIKQRLLSNDIHFRNRSRPPRWAQIGVGDSPMNQALQRH